MEKNILRNAVVLYAQSEIGYLFNSLNKLTLDKNKVKEYFELFQEEQKKQFDILIKLEKK